MVASQIKGPLSGVKVLDLTHVWAGPLAVRTLGDLGATIVKVERPFARGIQKQGATPVGGWLTNTSDHSPQALAHWNRSGAYIKLQRNRFGIALDYKTPAGRSVFLELVACADVVVENYSAGAMDAMGLSFDTLKAANPEIIYVTMPGYGSTGPYSDRVAFGTVIESLSALTYMTGYSEDEPFNSAQALPDAMGGMHTVAAITTALNQRKRTGKGARVEVSLHEAGVTTSGPWLVAQQIDPTKPRPMGNAHPQMSPHGVYRCLGDDQWLALSCEDDQQWRDLCELLGAAVLDQSDVSMHWTLAERHKNIEVIDKVIEGWTSVRQKIQATQQLQDAGVPAGPVNSAPEMLDDTQLNARGFYDWKDRFDVKLQGNPVHLDSIDKAERTRGWLPSPYLGEHNAEVLTEWLGYTEEQLRELLSANVLVTQPPS